MPKVGDLVHVVWEDHYSAADGWRRKDELSAPPDYTCQSAGVVVVQDKGRLTLAMNWTNCRENDKRAADCMIIMKPSIRKITTLKRNVW